MYLAAALAAHSQIGLPAFGIYGREVTDRDDGEIPSDVREKLLLFAKAGIAAALMRGRSYLSIGGVSMGIAGSVVDGSFFRDYLGMRNEYVDMSEITRRIREEIYDREENFRALLWVKGNCAEAPDTNPPEKMRTRSAEGFRLGTVIKMTMI